MSVSAPEKDVRAAIRLQLQRIVPGCHGIAGGLAEVSVPGWSGECVKRCAPARKDQHSDEDRWMVQGSGCDLGQAMDHIYNEYLVRAIMER